MRKRKQKTTSHTYAVLFGYDLNDIDRVGYFGKDLKISEDIDGAKQFEYEQGDSSVSGFATPDKWLKFINESPDLNHGFKFHICKMRQTK